MNPLLESIHQIELDIEHNEDALRKHKETMQDRVEAKESYQFIQEARAQMKALTTQLKIDMENDGEIMAGLDQINTIRQDISDLKETLSLHLVQYRLDTGEEQVPVPGSNTDAKPILLKAKLGKIVHYQERLAY